MTKLRVFGSLGILFMIVLVVISLFSAVAYAQSQEELEVIVKILEERRDRGELTAEQTAQLEEMKGRLEEIKSQKSWYSFILEGKFWSGAGFVGWKAINIVFLIALLYIPFFSRIMPKGDETFLGAKKKYIFWVIFWLIVLGSIFGGVDAIPLVGKLFTIHWTVPALTVLLLFAIGVPILVGHIYDKESEMNKRSALIWKNIGTKLRWFAKSIFSEIPIINKWFRQKEPTLEGHLPALYEKNRDLFYDLVHYTTREEVFHNYWTAVEQSGELLLELNAKVGVYQDYDKLKEELNALRFGGNVEAKLVRRGWNGLNLEVIEMLNSIIIISNRILAELGEASTTEQKIEVLSTYENNVATLSTNLSGISGLLEDYYDKKFYPRLGYFGYHKIANALRIYGFDQLNSSGLSLYYPHTYIFCKPNVIFKELATGKLIRCQDQQQITIDGIWMDDQFENMTDDGNLMPGYKVKKLADPVKDRKFPNPEQLQKIFATDIFQEWKTFIEDIRFGSLHPNTRTFDVYEHALIEDPKVIRAGFIDDSRVPLYRGKDPAFDLRVRMNPGKFWYKGRRKHDYTIDKAKDDRKNINPYPTMTSFGLRETLKFFIGHRVKEPEIHEMLFKMFPGDTGVAIEKPTKETSLPAVGHLG